MFERFLKSDAEKVEAEQVLALLKESPELQERSRQRDEKRVATIRQLLADRDKIKSEETQTMARLLMAFDEALAKEKRAHETLQAATQNRINAEYARLNAKSNFNLEISNLEAKIRKASPREIDEFIYEMIGADERTRSELNIEQREGAKSWITGEIKKIFNSNREAVEKKRIYIKAASAEAEGLKLQAVPHDQIVARLAKLKAGIPDSHQFKTVEFPLPDVSELRRVQ